MDFYSKIIRIHVPRHAVGEDVGEDDEEGDEPAHEDKQKCVYRDFVTTHSSLVHEYLVHLRKARTWNELFEFLSLLTDIGWEEEHAGAVESDEGEADQTGARRPVEYQRVDPAGPVRQRRLLTNYLDLNSHQYVVRT